MPVQAGLPFDAGWTGYDAGAGIAGFDVKYQVDGQEWTGWFTNTLDTEAMFLGETGHTYTFRVTARDNVGNAGQDEASVDVYSVVKYYNFNGQRIAMRRCGGENCGEAIYLHGDHLGSVSLATDADGNMVSQARFTPYGQVRWSGETVMPAKFSFTAQRSDGFGLMDYHARFYSPHLNRWISPDTIIPDPMNPLDFDRFSYVLGNPLKYTDPSGNDYCDSQYADPEECEFHDQADIPDDDCIADAFCYESYLTYNDLIWDLGRIPEPWEILYMTAYGEYFPFINVGNATTMGGVGLRALGQEGLARNWYEACGPEDATCTDNQLYDFMSGYEVWWRKDQKPNERANNLIKQLSQTENRSLLLEDVNQILDYSYASDRRRRWNEGSYVGRPWQWRNMDKPPDTLGKYWPAQAIGYITLRAGSGYYGDYFWVLSADQDYCLNHPNDKQYCP